MPTAFVNLEFAGLEVKFKIEIKRSTELDTVKQINGYFVIR